MKKSKQLFPNPADNIYEMSDKLTNISTAKAFLEKYVGDNRAGAIDTNFDLSGIQPRVGTEKECIDEFFALPAGERIELIGKLNPNFNNEFFVRAYRFSTITEAAERVQVLMKKAAAAGSPAEIEAMRKDIEEEIAAQPAVLDPMRSRMSAGLTVAPQRADTYSEDVYQSLATCWRDFYRQSPFFFDSDGDKSYDKAIPGTVEEADVLPDNPVFSTDADKDGVPDTYDAAPADPNIFFDASRFSTLDTRNAFDISVEGTGDTQVITITVKILLENSKEAPVKNLQKLALKWGTETQPFIEKAMPAEFKGKIHIQPIFEIDPNRPHHAIVKVKDSGSKGENDANDVVSWFSNISDQGRTHEIGHMLGWRDRYHNFPQFGCRYDRTFTPGIPTNRRFNDIMLGSSPESKISADDIKQTLALTSSGLFGSINNTKDQIRYWVEYYNFAERKNWETGEAALNKMFDNLEQIVLGYESAIGGAHLSSEEKKRLIKIAVEWLGGEFKDIKNETRFSAYYSSVAAGQILKISRDRIAKLITIAAGEIRACLVRTVEEFDQLNKNVQELAGRDYSDQLGSAGWTLVGEQSKRGISGNVYELSFAFHELKREWAERSDNKETITIGNIEQTILEDAKPDEKPLRALKIAVRIDNGAEYGEIYYLICIPPPITGQDPYSYAAKLYETIKKAKQEYANRRPLDVFAIAGPSVNIDGDGAFALKTGLDYFLRNGGGVGAAIEARMSNSGTDVLSMFGPRLKIEDTVVGIDIGVGYLDKKFSGLSGLGMRAKMGRLAFGAFLDLSLPDTSRSSLSMMTGVDF